MATRRLGYDKPVRNTIGGMSMKTIIAILMGLILVLFVVLVGMGFAQKPMTDEEAEKKVRQLNDWQDRDILEE